MQTTKMSLDNIKGKLSRAEMKNIMAGTSCTTPDDCPDKQVKCGGKSYDGNKNCRNGSCVYTTAC